MYRQVNIHQRDETCNNFCGKGTLMTYELATATYGTAPAPYLATCCLSSLHKILAPKALMNNFYVDDALCGPNTTKVE
jgi:hypothetical protein